MPEKELEINYEATDKDEECFFLMYHMNQNVEAVYNLPDERRRWMIGRFIAQKKSEEEMMRQDTSIITGNGLGIDFD